MWFRWPGPRRSIEITVNEAVPQDLFSNPLNPLAQLIDGECCRRIGHDLRLHRGYPPGSFAEPSLHDHARVYAYGTILMRYIIRRKLERRWLVFYDERETVEVIDLIVLPFGVGR